MKSYTNLLRALLPTTWILMLAAAVSFAQQPTTSGSSTQPANTSEVKKSTSTAKEEPTSTTTGEEAGNYTVTSSIEFGYRGFSMAGDEDKYKSDLNYKAGPRLFDTSFLMRSKDRK